MKIEFRKITSIPKSFHLKIEGVSLEGKIWKVSTQLYQIRAKLVGKMLLVCDKSGEEYVQTIDECLSLYTSNGIWDMQSQNHIDGFDVVEFFEGFVDFEYLLQSEIDSIRIGYHTKEGE